VGTPEDQTVANASASTTAPPTTAANSPETSTPDREDPNSGAALRRGSSGRNPLVTGLMALGALAVLYLLVVPASQRWVVRRRRRAATSASEQVLAAWQETQDALALAGHPRRRSETATEFAERAAPALTTSGPELTLLASETDAAGFSANGITADAVPLAQKAALAVATELRAQVPPVRRVLWALDPRPVVEAAAEALLKRGPTLPS
jgi:hypothetical protein